MGKNEKLVTTSYSICVPKMPSCKLAMVSDLHDYNADAVIEILKEEKPDLILAAGDMIERCTYGESEFTKDVMNGYQGIVNDGSLRYKLSRFLLRAGELFHKKEKTDKFGLDFLKQISVIAPVFYGVGNHEWYFFPEDLALFKAHGITLLDNNDAAYSFPKTSQEQMRILIGGLSTRYDLEWLDTFSKKDGPKILICHHPEYYFRHIKGTALDTFDLIVAGHVHGGQWRIGGRGVLAPGQGFFPKYTHGLHDGKLVIGTGISNTACVPRWGNPMEVVIIRVNERKTRIYKYEC